MGEQAPTHVGDDTRAGDLLVDRDELRLDVQAKYAAVALAPNDAYHFHTGAVAAERCRYDMAAVDVLPTVAVESFAGVANPFELRQLEPGSTSSISDPALASTASSRRTRSEQPATVVGIDMTDEMLAKSRDTAASSGSTTWRSCTGTSKTCRRRRLGRRRDIERRDQPLPGQARDLRRGMAVLKSGGVMQFADIANGNPVPDDAKRNIDLWTG